MLPLLVLAAVRSSGMWPDPECAESPWQPKAADIAGLTRLPTAQPQH